MGTGDRGAAASGGDATVLAEKEKTAAMEAASARLSFIILCRTPPSVTPLCQNSHFGFVGCRQKNVVSRQFIKAGFVREREQGTYLNAVTKEQKETTRFNDKCVC